METKKISFGFSKITQKNNFIQPQPKEEVKVELIKCLEGKEIKLVEEPKPKELLVIPMKEVGKTSAALASLIKRRAVLNDEAEPETSECKDQNGTVVVDQDVVMQGYNLEQRAARELLSEAKSHDEIAVDTKLVLPVLKPEELPLEGAKEPTFDDYESIPIEQFGRAMLRGMGWVDPPPDKNGTALPEGPAPRPKGMGLGADKAIKPKPLLVQPEKNEVLEIKRKAFVRVLGGKHKDMYGQIEDFDDFAGRIIVRMAIGGSMEVFNEFMCQPIAKKEYEQYAKCINSAKYEAYKKLENEYGQIIINKDELKNVEITKSDFCKNLKEFSLKEEKRDRNFEEKYVEKSYERSRDKDRKYKDNDNLRNKDSRAYSPSAQAGSSSQHHKNLPSSSARRDYKESEAHTSRSRHKRKVDSDSSDTESTDSEDSAFKRRHKKKSSKSSSRKKSKKSKSKRRDYSSGTDNDSSEAEKRHKIHKKKTKKSKRERSRSRSRGRR